MLSRVVSLGDRTDVVAGVRFIPAPGHRTGHAVYEMETTPLLHLGDALFAPSQIADPRGGLPA